jgi:hypothetical protein
MPKNAVKPEYIYHIYGHHKLSVRDYVYWFSHLSQTFQLVEIEVLDLCKDWNCLDVLRQSVVQSHCRKRRRV